MSRHAPAVAVASVVVAAGCAHVQPPSELRALVGETVEFETEGGTGTGVVVATPTGLALRDATGAIVTAPVTKVRVTQRGRGALEGLGLGALIGVGIVALIGLADAANPEPPPTDTCGHCEQLVGISDGAALLLGAIFLGGTGGLTGAVIGGVKGSDDVYEAPELVRVVPTGPPGTVLGATVRF